MFVIMSHLVNDKNNEKIIGPKVNTKKPIIHGMINHRNCFFLSIALGHVQRFHAVSVNGCPFNRYFCIGLIWVINRIHEQFSSF